MEYSIVEFFALGTVAKMTNKKQWVEGDRLFYELGRTRKILNVSSGNKNDSPYYLQSQLRVESEFVRVKDGTFKEINNPKDFISGDERMNDPAYLHHHNFMIVKGA